MRVSRLFLNQPDTNLEDQVLEKELMHQLKNTEFLDSSLHIFIDFCNKKEYQNYLKPNVPLSALERRSELEVRAQKNGDVRFFPTVEVIQPPPTADLVVALADFLHNVSTFKGCPVELWNEQGIYRILFRCASWSRGNPESDRVRTATCRALVAAASHKCVRASLAATKDCLVNLLLTFTSTEEGDCDELTARMQTMLLLASLLSERAASNTVWNELRERQSTPFFRLLTLSLQSDDDELKDAAMHCLTQLTKSALNKKHADKTSDETCKVFLNDLKFDNQQASARSGAGDTGRDDDCQPEYVCEELCKLLIYHFQDLFDKKKSLASQDNLWIRVCSCLSSLLSVSSRSRLYGVHRQFPLVLLAALQTVRDQLSLQGKPVDVIRNANHDPALNTLYWLLTIINCSMLECKSAKESFADNITGSVNRLWPWCMMTEQLRNTILHLLIAFTNDCPKAWACMCACVGGRSLLAELCALACRSGASLLPALRILRQCVPHHHCRAILLKSEVMSCMNKAWSRGGRYVRGAEDGGGTEWVRLCAALARHADGGGVLLALLAATPRRGLSARLLPALANAAHHHRAAFLQSPELLEILSATLLTGNISEVVLAARAVWALAANSHRVFKHLIFLLSLLTR
ncbi:unnamed protein product [Parnassius apollo]|uniref:(apollo) hypothetical protein n=1 Tax=Parnassius apollo TaxID=110799 RepID=A0A8S3X226_PARAO|nr:unnamed protein product [Parnassius apollo]